MTESEIPLLRCEPETKTIYFTLYHKSHNPQPDLSNLQRE